MGCTDPVAPEYEYKEGLVYIDAYISTAIGSSYTRISETVLIANKLKNFFVGGATVSYRNVNTNFEVFLMESEQGYFPPSEFHATVGEAWELLITLPDGRKYQSEPETIIESVGFSNLRANYDKALEFRESIDDFVPGHLISIDIDDPGGEENYYFWKFRTFEKLKVCGQCYESILRDGQCVNAPKPIEEEKTFTYGCETDCWQIRYNEDIRIFSDDFSNGALVQSIPVGHVLLFTKNNITVEVQQYSLSATAHKYYRVIKDIVDNNGGFNAPPPAALIGNMFNPEDHTEFVLGRFTAASAVTKSIFIDRSQIKEKPFEPLKLVDPEKCDDICSLSDCSSMTPVPECIPVRRVPCEESRFRTQIRPKAWVDL